MNEETALLMKRLWIRNGAILLAELILLGISFCNGRTPGEYFFADWPTVAKVPFWTTQPN